MRVHIATCKKESEELPKLGKLSQNKSIIQNKINKISEIKVQDEL